MVLSIAILSVAVGILGLLLGNKTADCGGRPFNVVSTTTAFETAACESVDTSTETVTQTATDTLSNVPMTYYITSAYTVFVTKVFKETATGCALSIDPSQTTTDMERTHEKTSIDPAEKPSAFPVIATTPSAQTTSKTSKTSVSASASTPPPTDPGAVLHSETRPHLRPFISNT